MRDEKRIDRIIEKVAKLWHLVPNWRLCQLISNLHGPGPHDTFYTDDIAFEAMLDAQLADEQRLRK